MGTRRSLKVRFILVLPALLLCVYGIIGLSTSAQALVSNIRNHIHRLVLQVQLQDAFKGDSDHAITGANVFTAFFVSRLIFDWDLSHYRRATSFRRPTRQTQTRMPRVG